MGLASTGRACDAGVENGHRKHVRMLRRYRLRLGRDSVQSYSGRVAFLGMIVSHQRRDARCLSWRGVVGLGDGACPSARIAVERHAPLAIMLVPVERLDGWAQCRACFPELMPSLCVPGAGGSLCQRMRPPMSETSSRCTSAIASCMCRLGCSARVAISILEGALHDVGGGGGDLAELCRHLGQASQLALSLCLSPSASLRRLSCLRSP